ncbi:MAG: aldehyde dehydrogenase [Desulfobacterales bacterium]|nr:aldehyde dehydrogenase [Desulfobacterales bacterium]
MLRIAVNGFGRIGRIVSRINAENSRFKLIAINDTIPSVDNMAYLFKYDSTYGKFPGTVTVDNDKMIINGDEVSVTHKASLNDIPWDSYDVDVLIDSSGIEQNVTDAKKLLDDGVIKKFIYTMSSENVDCEVIVGVNDNMIESGQRTFSASICDANALAHILQMIDNEYKIHSGSVTTLHPWLTYQNLLDGAAKGIAPDPNKYTPPHIKENYGMGRASIGAMIPKKTTAVTCTEKILTSIKGKLLSHSYRIPTSTVSISDLVLKTEKKVTSEILIPTIEEWAKENPFVKLNYEPLISLDYQGEEASAVIDMQWLQVENDLIKIVLWYDNEWGYSSRVLDLVEKVIEV